MSRRKSAETRLLGPDGKPIDPAKYRPKPEPTVVEVKAEPARAGGFVYGASPYTMFSFDTLTITFGEPSAKAKPALKTAVEQQLAAIHDGLDMAAAPAELPKPPADDTYRSGWTSAVRNCTHQGDSIATRYDRNEYQCTDCGRYYIRKRGMFG